MSSTLEGAAGDFIYLAQTKSCYYDYVWEFNNLCIMAPSLYKMKEFFCFK